MVTADISLPTPSKFSFVHDEDVAKTQDYIWVKVRDPLHMITIKNMITRDDIHYIL